MAGLGAVALVGLNDRREIAGAAIMEEEDALANAPQRRGAELRPIRISLTNAILQAGPHTVYCYIGERAIGLVALAGKGRLGSGQRFGVAESATDGYKDIVATHG